MKTKLDIISSPKISVVAPAIAISCLLSLAVQAAAPAKTDAPATSQPKQKEFDSPKQAADALIQVAANFDVAAAKEILGPDSEDIVSYDVHVTNTTLLRFVVVSTRHNTSMPRKSTMIRRSTNTRNESSARRENMTGWRGRTRTERGAVLLEKKSPKR